MAGERGLPWPLLWPASRDNAGSTYVSEAALVAYPPGPLIQSDSPRENQAGPCSGFGDVDSRWLDSYWDVRDRPFDV